MQICSVQEKPHDLGLWITHTYINVVFIFIAPFCVSFFLICTYVQYSVGYHCKILYFNMFCCAEYGYRIVFIVINLGYELWLKETLTQIVTHRGVFVMYKLHMHASEYIWFSAISLTRYSTGTLLVTKAVKVGRKFYCFEPWK